MHNFPTENMKYIVCLLLSVGVYVLVLSLFVCFFNWFEQPFNLCNCVCVCWMDWLFVHYKQNNFGIEHNIVSITIEHYFSLPV